MPDLYARGDYDLAGFCVGVAERKRMIDGKAIAADDIAIGVASSGLHSNGYSLARRIVFDIAGMGIHDFVPECSNSTVADLLLEPTKIYTQPVRRILQHYRVKSVVHGIAHITGGGLHENLERILPTGVRVLIDRESWTMPEVFPWLQKLGNVDDDEMFRVFNMGVGLVLMVSPFYAESVRSQLADFGLESWIIGRAVAGERAVVWA
jgi:phosphoribosylformylglycinamidine cyclo-ligase